MVEAQNRVIRREVFVAREKRPRGRSDRGGRFSRVLARAVEVYDGDRERALAWLESPLVALGGKRPVDLLSTEAGALEVETILGRLEHGVFS